MGSITEVWYNNVLIAMHLLAYFSYLIDVGYHAVLDIYRYIIDDQNLIRFSCIEWLLTWN